jgi:anti-sigma regulatory factor (Ser/Thr protein kinase)
MLACRLKAGSATPLPGAVADFVKVLAEEAGLSSRQAYWLRLAADEITTNIAHHGYRGGQGAVDITGEVEPDRLRVWIEDDAPPFDPTHYDPAPRLSVPPGEREEEGGYGLLLALGKVDEFSYEFVDGRNRNILTIWLRGREVSDDAERPGGR